MAGRWNALEAEEKQKPERIAKDVKILHNLKISWCSFWNPITAEGWNELEQWEEVPNHFLEMCLLDQLKERQTEFKEFAEKAYSEEHKEILFDGMPEIVKKWLEKTASSSRGSFSAAPLKDTPVFVKHDGVMKQA